MAKRDLTASELADKWGVTRRRIGKLARRVKGAYQAYERGPWMFPANCKDPRRDPGRPKKR